MNSVYIIEKRRKLGEIEKMPIYVWEFHVVVKTKNDLVSWSRERGHYVDEEHETLDSNLRFFEYFL